MAGRTEVVRCVKIEVRGGPHGVVHRWASINEAENNAVVKMFSFGSAMCQRINTLRASCWARTLPMFVHSVLP